jgi:uncharacterized membrane protein
MSFVSNPIYVLMVLSLSVLLAHYAGKTKWGKHFGAALLVILITAVLANFKLIPSASNSIDLYDRIFEYVAPISIFYLLLNVNLNSIKSAGFPMIGLFIVGSMATTLGILISWMVFSPENLLGKDAKVIAGMLTGTYTGGSVNFNAIALEYGFQEKGILYAGTIAVDNVVTTFWIIATLSFPVLLARFWKSKTKSKLLANSERETPKKGMNLVSLAWLAFLGIASLYISNGLGDYFTQIPSILILSTLGIGLAQIPWVAKLEGSHDLGLYLVFLFLAVIGAYCEFSAVYQLEQIGMTLLLFTCLAVLLHGVIIILIGGLVYRDWEMIAIVSQANIGGGASAIAVAETFGRNDLILPAILVGTLGNALGTYLGFLVVYIV